MNSYCQCSKSVTVCHFLITIGLYTLPYSRDIDSITLKQPNYLKHIFICTISKKDSDILSQNKCFLKARGASTFITQTLIYIQQGHSRWQTENITPLRKVLVHSPDVSSVKHTLESFFFIKFDLHKIIIKKY